MESAAEVRNSVVPAKSKGHIEAQLTIPAVPPTNIQFCTVLQVSYEIHIVACVGGIHRNAVLRLPVTIGTIPLRSFQYSSLPTAPVWNMSPPGTSVAVATAPLPEYNASQAGSASAPAAPYSQDLRTLS